MKRIIYLFVLLFSTTLTFANDIDTQFEAAGTAYNEGKYRDAVNLYVKILKEGYHSHELHYNMGNACFKNKNVGLARLHYERALRLKNDAETRENLEQLVQTIDSDLIQVKPFWAVDIWNNIRNIASSTVWSILTILLIWLALGGILTWLFHQKRSFKKLGFTAALLFITISILTFFLAQSQSNNEYKSGYAIVLKKKTNLTEAPDSKSIKFEIKEGEKVQLLDKINGSYEVRLIDGETGWLPISDVEEI